MSINSSKFKEFWESRIKQQHLKNSFSITNLEENEDLVKQKVKKEKEKIDRIIKLSPGDTLLDLGCGMGHWSIIFAKKCKKVVAVDYLEEMTSYLKKDAKKKSINNIEFYTQNIFDYKPNRIFDYVFLSGVLIYLLDKDIKKLSANISNYTDKGSHIFVRDATGILGRYEIDDEYSEHLRANYSAIYRTRDEYIDIFDNIGFKLIVDDDMFEDGSELNKWKETRLRIYLFKKE